MAKNRISLVGLIVLFISASFRTVYIMPLFPPFALLAAQGMMRLTERFFRVWNRIVRIGFTLAALGIWVIWWNLSYPPLHRPIPWLVRRFDHIFPPDLVPAGFQLIACTVAVIVALYWIISWRIKDNSPFGTARIFFTGAALVWCTSHTLLLPWINETKSFRTTVRHLEEYIKTSPYANTCIGHYRLGENMAPMIQYFMNLDHPLPIVNLEGNTCPLLLTFALVDEPTDIDPRWKMLWHGTRPLDIKSSELRLYEHVQ
jgi:hypothetical protein